MGWDEEDQHREDEIQARIRAAVQAGREQAYVRGYNDGYAAYAGFCAIKGGCGLAAAEDGKVLTQDEIRARGKEGKPDPNKGPD